MNTWTLWQLLRSVKSRRVKRTEELLELVDLKDKSRNMWIPFQGMKRGSAWRSLIHNPEFLILMNSASGMDPGSVEMKGTLKP